ncbi:hypothetical protein [Macrococcoides bohemicum]|uniref:hypothetical protein n=1 Tax=Macrococcoides bohemicum TaxID=1903056 RepID=UPI00193EDEA7|nr:hypothetical protein [Macrococcus bohemicus]QRN48693.1 hypothetical protein HT586_00605 [Macrococcus bohemicus]
MTKYPQIKINMNNETISYEEINRWAVKRAVHVLQEISELGGELYLNDTLLNPLKLHELSNEELLNACAETKVKLGFEKIQSLYSDLLAQGAQMFKDIQQNKNSNNLKETHVQVEVDGVDPSMIAKMITTDSHDDLNINVAYGLHPEHFIFKLHGTTQEVMENIGTYKFPLHFKLELKDHNVEAPGELRSDAIATTLAKVYLIDDGFDTGVYAMHQFIKKDNGMIVDLGLYVPENTPDEFLIGHREHFAIEFGNLFKNIINMMNLQK